jgi:hypothetical protein
VYLSLREISDCNSPALRSFLSTIAGRSIPSALLGIDQKKMLDKTCEYILDSVSDINRLFLPKNLPDNELTWVKRNWNKIGQVTANSSSNIKFLEKIKSTDGHHPKIIYSSIIKYSKDISIKQMSDIEVIKKVADEIQWIIINVDDMEM